MAGFWEGLLTSAANQDSAPEAIKPLCTSKGREQFQRASMAFEAMQKLDYHKAMACGCDDNIQGYPRVVVIDGWMHGIQRDKCHLTAVGHADRNSVPVEPTWKNADKVVMLRKAARTHLRQ